MSSTAGTLVLTRHGESVWNLEGRFTGWTDVPLSDKGRDEARRAGKKLADAGFRPDVLHTSLLSRAIFTAQIALEEMGRPWIPVQRSWRLNERHYGALQGLNKEETARKHGPEQVKLWRRSYDVPPPALTDDDPRHPKHDERYLTLSPEVPPATESLADVVVRLLPYWQDVLAPQLRAGQHVLVVAHGNSLRALIKQLDGISDSDIVGLELPTGAPITYSFDAQLRKLGRTGL